jgi:hypothetical protein
MGRAEMNVEQYFETDRSLVRGGKEVVLLYLNLRLVLVVFTLLFDK